MNKQEMEYRKKQRRFEAMNKPKMVYPSHLASQDSHANNMVMQMMRFYFKHGNGATMKLLDDLDQFREEINSALEAQKNAIGTV